MSVYALLALAERTAAKPHRCIWCWQHIKRGERYLDERSVFDGEFQRHHWHPECRGAMLAESAAEGGVIEWTPGQVRPALSGAPT